MDFPEDDGCSAANACSGEWMSKGRLVTICAGVCGGPLTLQMGPDTPTLEVLPDGGDSGVEVWPMKWHAVRPGGSPEDALYILELPTPSSKRMQVRRPVGDNVIEFVRPGVENSQLPPATLPAAAAVVAAPGGGALAIVTQSSAPERSPPRGGGGSVRRDVRALRQALRKGRDALVVSIKQGQREDPEFKTRWWEYCDRRGNGFYDPMRHDGRFLEEFVSLILKDSKGGASRSGSRSRSYSDSRSKSRSKNKSPRRRKRRMRRRKRRGGSRGGGGRRGGRRKEGGKKRKRSRSGSASCSASPSRSKELADAERARDEAERDLAKATADLSSDALAREEERRQAAEIERAVAAARDQGERELQSRLKEADSKLRDEKVSRLKEAEQRLDKAIEQRLEEAIRVLRKDTDKRLEDVAKKLKEAGKQEIERKKSSTRGEATEAVEKAKTRLKAAKARLANLEKPGRTGRGKRSHSAGEGGADDASGSRDGSRSEGSSGGDSASVSGDSN